MSVLNDIYIAVVGHPGAGKSDFIRLCTGKDTGVGDTRYPLISYTKQIRAWPLVHQGRLIHLIDTPGHHGRETRDLCRRLELGLAGASISRENLHGIIVIHDISRGWGSVVDGQLMLKTLFKREKPASRNNRLVLATNRWDNVSLEMGQAQESRLDFEVWGIHSTSLRKSNCVRLDLDKESCLTVLDTLLRNVIPSDPENRAEKTLGHQEDISGLRQKITSPEQAHQAPSVEDQRPQNAHAPSTNHIAEKESYETQIASLKANVEELTQEVAALKAYIAEAERTATGYWGGVEIPPVPYSLEPPRQPSD